MVSAGFDWVGAEVVADDPDDPPPTDPKKSLTFLPLRALATAESNPLLKLTPEAFNTAVNDA